MSVEPTDNALASAAEEMAHKILKRKRDNFQRTQQAGGSSSGRKRRSADGTVVATADPVLKALRLKGSRRTRSGGETNPPVQQQTTLMVAVVHFSPQNFEGGGRVHVTETWIFASEDMTHDCDFHLHGLAKITDHYLHGDESQATAAARKEGRTPRMHMFTDGCGKQYKGRRNFRFLADSVRHIGFFIDHHFAATNHFNGCHDDIGGVAKNAMREREKYGKRIMGADGVVSFLKSFFRKEGGEGEEGMRRYFARWSPYRIRRVHVQLIGKNEIYRPGSELAGIEGTRDMYHFAGENVPKHDAATTTEGLENDAALVLKQERGGRLSQGETERLAEIGEVTVLKVKGWESNVELEGPISGEEEVTVRKVKRRHPVKTRLASCFCSSCQMLNYDECHTTRTYPTLVPAFESGEVKETVIMDTGVAPGGLDGPSVIKFGARKKKCKVSRVTGTQWEESDQDSARELWDDLGHAEEPPFFAAGDQFDD